jgi:hypothetical protein
LTSVGPRRVPQSSAVLIVGDLFQPFDDFAVELFQNGDVRHSRGRRRSVPVLLAGREPDHITGPDLLHRSAFALNPTAASRHQQGLTEGMGVPRRPSAWLKRDT